MNPYPKTVQSYSIEGFDMQVAQTDADHYEAMISQGSMYHVLRSDLRGNTTAFFSLGPRRDVEGGSFMHMHPTEACRHALALAIQQTVQAVLREQVPH